MSRDRENCNQDTLYENKVFSMKEKRDMGIYNTYWKGK